MTDLLGWINDYFHSPSGRDLFELLGALSTVAVAGFAWVQYGLQRRQHEDSLRSATGAVWSEWWRMWTVAKRWEAQDIKGSIAAGVFRPEEILPEDWSSLRALTGVLGHQVSVCVGMARAEADLAVSGGRLAIEVERKLRERRHGVSIMEAAQLDADISRKLDGLIADVRGHALRAAEIMQDATTSVPVMLQTADVDFSGLSSEFGATMHREMVRRRALIPRWRRALAWLGFKRALVIRRSLASATQVPSVEVDQAKASEGLAVK